MLPVDDSFLAGFKAATERRWAENDPAPDVFGFQFVRGTHWRPGLDDEALARLERTYSVLLPDDMRRFLKAMNGTDPDTVNNYGGTADPVSRPGVFSFPRDEAAVRERLDYFAELGSDIKDSLAREGYELPAKARLLPFYAHRAVVCGPDPKQSAVISVHPGDAIVYGRDLREYLVQEFLKAP